MGSPEADSPDAGRPHCKNEAVRKAVEQAISSVASLTRIEASVLDNDQDVELGGPAKVETVFRPIDLVLAGVERDVHCSILNLAAYDSRRLTIQSDDQ
jgi:hypothetical protein